MRWGRAGEGRLDPAVGGPMAAILHSGATLRFLARCLVLFSLMLGGEWVGFGRRQTPDSQVLTSLPTTVSCLTWSYFSSRPEALPAVTAPLPGPPVPLAIPACPSSAFVPPVPVPRPPAPLPRAPLPLTPAAPLAGVALLPVARSSAPLAGAAALPVPQPAAPLPGAPSLSGPAAPAAAAPATAGEDAGRARLRQAA